MTLNWIFGENVSTKALPSGTRAHLVEGLGAAAVGAAAVDAGEVLDEGGEVAVHLQQCQLGPPTVHEV